jgi:SAM-dependent methyltransferase
VNEERDELSPIVRSNVERWSADDDGWRGYRRDDGKLIPDDRVQAGLRLVSPRPGGALLDIGCANGILTTMFAREARVERVFGVDFVDHGLDPKLITFRQANLDKPTPLPFDSRSLDVVTCLETLEHLHDTDYLVSEIRRLLLPSGYAILSVPRLDGLLAIGMLAAGFQPPAIECSLRRRYGSPDSGQRVSGHVSHFTRRALDELVGANGMKVDGFAQASIYSAWRYATAVPPPAWQRIPMWALSKIPFKQDNLIVRIRPSDGGATRA